MDFIGRVLHEVQQTGFGGVQNAGKPPENGGRKRSFSLCVTQPGLMDGTPLN